MAYTLYGLVTSQFGDIEDSLDTGEKVKDFVTNYFGYDSDFLGIVGLILVGFTLVFGFCFAFAIKAFNFQKR